MSWREHGMDSVTQETFRCDGDYELLDGVVWACTHCKSILNGEEAAQLCARICKLEISSARARERPGEEK